jgi:hypothetical protein
MFTVMLRDLGGKAGHMTTAKSTSKTAMGRGDLRSPSAGKTESPQNDRPPADARVAEAAASASDREGASTAVPAVILWDDPVTARRRQAQGLASGLPGRTQSAGISSLLASAENVQ